MELRASFVNALPHFSSLRRAEGDVAIQNKQKNIFGKKTYRPSGILLSLDRRTLPGVVRDDGRKGSSRQCEFPRIIAIMDCATAVCGYSASL